MIIIIMISTTIFQNITVKLEKMTYLFSLFRGCYCRPRCNMPPMDKWIRKDIKLGLTISKHKQAFIPTAT